MIGDGEKKQNKQKFLQRKCPKKKKLCKEKRKEKKTMRELGGINSSRNVFQNAPNGFRAYLDFENFPGGGYPGPP